MATRRPKGIVKAYIVIELNKRTNELNFRDMRTFWDIHALELAVAYKKARIAEMEAVERNPEYIADHTFIILTRID